MKVTKDAQMGQSAAATEQDLEMINQFSKKPLTREEVFTFEITLCDNDVDRDYERFSTAALGRLQTLMLGKTGIFDHEWSAKGQKARVFRTEVVHDAARSTMTGEAYAYLQAGAYMLRSQENAELIAEIEAGIKKEVSIGCSVSGAVCSICGEDMSDAKCGHRKGQTYDGRVCYAILENPTDAYEWSFVAVPAQKNAGVMKRFARSACREQETLKGFLEAYGEPAYLDALYQLEMEAEAGKRYLEELRAEVTQLCLLTAYDMPAEMLQSVLGKMSAGELLAFRGGLQKKLDEVMPPEVQLGVWKKGTEPFSGEAFLI